jgi:hypothetical protein
MDVFYRNVHDVLQFGQGEQEAAGVGEQEGGLHEGKQLEEDEAKTQETTQTTSAARFQTAPKKEAKTMRFFQKFFVDFSCNKCIF